MPFGNNPTQMDILSTPYGLSGQLSPEIALEQQALNRKQMIANALLQQGMNHAQGQMVGRFYVPASPLQHVGSLAQTAVGAFGTGHLDDQRKGLVQQQQQLKADAIRKFMQQTQGRDIPERTLPQGSPEQIIPDGPPVQDDSKNYGLAPAPMQQPTTTIPAVPPTQGPVNPAMHEPAPEGQRRQAIIEAMTSQVPGMREAAQFLQQQEALKAEREAQRAYRQESLDVRREGIEANAATRAEMIRGNMLNTQAQIDARLQAGQDANALKAELARQQADLQKVLHGMDNKRAIDVANINAEAKKDATGLKRQDKAAEAKTSVDMAVNTLSATRDVAKELLNHEGLGRITGLMGALPNIPGSKAADAEAVLKRLSSMASIQMINDLRQASKTGGAVGQVTEREWGYLASAAAKLDKAQGTPAFKGALEDYVKQLDRVESLITDAYGRQFGGSQQSTAGQGPSVGTVEDGYRFKGGNPADQSSWEKVQ
jgi:hypothetical protein